MNAKTAIMSDWCKPVLLLGLAAYIVALGFGIYATRNWLLVNDAPLMQYIAQGILQGAVPYRDMFDMNMPLVYLIHIAEQLVFPPTDYGFRLFDLAWLAFTALALVMLMRPEGPIAQICAACFFISYHLSLGNMQMAQRDFFLCPFAVLTAHYFRRAGETQNTGYFGLSGLFLGAALSIKPSIAPLGLCMVAFLPSVMPWRKAPRCLVFFAVGILFIPLLLALWLMAIGAYPYFSDIFLGFVLPIYSRVGRVEIEGVSRLIVLSTGAFIPILLIAYRTSLSPNLQNIILLGIAGGAFHAFLQAKAWPYHIYPVAVFLSAMAGARVQALFSATPSYTRNICVIMCLVGFYTFAQGYALSPFLLAPAANGHVIELTADIHARVRTGDEVQVLDTNWGGLNALYHLNIRQPTRFIYDFPFYVLTDHPYIQGLRHEFMAQMLTTPPRLVVLTSTNFPTLDGFRRIERFPELVSFLNTQYTAVVTKPGYIIYQKL